MCPARARPAQRGNGSGSASDVAGEPVAGGDTRDDDDDKLRARDTSPVTPRAPPSGLRGWDGIRQALAPEDGTSGASGAAARGGTVRDSATGFTDGGSTDAGTGTDTGTGIGRRDNSGDDDVADAWPPAAETMTSARRAAGPEQTGVRPADSAATSVAAIAASIDTMPNAAAVPDAGADADADADLSACPICFDEEVARHDRVVVPTCRHAFCAPCLLAWCAVRATCPLCKVAFDSCRVRRALDGARLDAPITESVHLLQRAQWVRASAPACGGHALGRSARGRHWRGEHYVVDAHDEATTAAAAAAAANSPLAPPAPCPARGTVSDSALAPPTHAYATAATADADAAHNEDEEEAEAAREEEFWRREAAEYAAGGRRRRRGGDQRASRAPPHARQRSHASAPRATAAVHGHGHQRRHRHRHRLPWQRRGIAAATIALARALAAPWRGTHAEASRTATPPPTLPPRSPRATSASGVRHA